MTTATTNATLFAAEPMVFCHDIATACEFFTRTLGFTVAFTSGDPPFYAQVSRDGARLNLRHADGPVFHPDFRSTTPDALSATITLDDAGALFAEFRRAGATFHQTIRTEPWGARTFIVQDPDGNLFLFAGRTG
jgi:catechol 2,3-dioxygenase-like lactoylglutathione lyase family enzyme